MIGLGQVLGDVVVAILATLAVVGLGALLLWLVIRTLDLVSND